MFDFDVVTGPTPPRGPATREEPPAAGAPEPPAAGQPPGGETVRGEDRRRGW